MAPVTLMIVGAGSRGMDSYGRYCLEHPEEFKVIAIAEPSEERRELMGNLHSVKASMRFKDWQDAVAQPRLTDAVLITTPDELHSKPAIRLMKKGYHVLLEKPIAPDEYSCRKVVMEAKEQGGIFAVCHVLRYSPYYQFLRKLIKKRVIGHIVTVRHIEKVGYWHQAHSYVRGNWRNSDQTSPMILAKSCHDMDLLLFLLEKKCIRISSFGGLKFFIRENKPEGATDRCVNCLYKDTCVYSAERFYFECLRSGCRTWPLNVVDRSFTEKNLYAALQGGPYGRCAFECDNTAVDHQVVNMEFEGGITASFTMTAFSQEPARHTEIMGSHGKINASSGQIFVERFGSKRAEVYDFSMKTSTAANGHCGGDRVLMRCFYEAVLNDEPERLYSGPDISLEGHRMAFAAEKSRMNDGTVVELDVL